MQKRRSSKPRRGAGPLVALAANDGWNVVNYRAPLIRSLQQAGIEVAILAPDGPHTPAIRQMGADFHEIPMSARGKAPSGGLSVSLSVVHRRSRELAQRTFH